MVLAATLPMAATAGVVSVGFEQFSDLDAVTTQVDGVTFSNATAMSAGLSLNDAEFPPHGGSNAVFDDGGAMTIAFASPVLSVSAYVTYVAGLTFDVFDSADQLLAHLTGQFTSNLAASGDAGSAPNEWFQFTGVDIARVVITGDAFGGSFVLDDLSFDDGVTATIPEPATLGLVATLLGAGSLPGGWLRRRRAQR